MILAVLLGLNSFFMLLNLDVVKRRLETKNRSIVNILISSVLLFISVYIYGDIHFYEGIYELILGPSRWLKVDEVTSGFLLFGNISFVLMGVKSLFEDRSDHLSFYIPLINVFLLFLAGDFYIFAFLFVSLILGFAQGKGSELFQVSQKPILLGAFGLSLLSVFEKYFDSDRYSELMPDNIKVIIFSALVFLVVGSFIKWSAKRDDIRNSDLLADHIAFLIKTSTLSIMVYKVSFWRLTHDAWMDLAGWLFLLLHLYNFCGYILINRKGLFPLLEGIVYINIVMTLALGRDLLFDYSVGLLASIYLFRYLEGFFANNEEKPPNAFTAIFLIMTLGILGSILSFIPLLNIYFNQILNSYYEFSPFYLFEFLFVFSLYSYFIGWRFSKEKLLSFNSEAVGYQTIDMVYIVIIAIFVAVLNYVLTTREVTYALSDTFYSSNKLLVLLVLNLITVLMFVLGHVTYSKLAGEGVFEGWYSRFGIRRNEFFNRRKAKGSLFLYLLPTQGFFTFLNRILRNWPENLLIAAGDQMRASTSKNIQSGLIYLLFAVGTIIYLLLLL